MLGRIGRIALLSAMGLRSAGKKMPCTVIDNASVYMGYSEFERKEMVRSILNFSRKMREHSDKFTKQNK